MGENEIINIKDEIYNIYDKGELSIAFGSF